MTESVGSIVESVSKLSGAALSVAGGLAVAGTLAMAFLQLVKELTPIRSAYQRRWLERWFTLRAEAFTRWAVYAGPGVIESDSARIDAKTAQADLVDLATGGERDAFYDLPIEQVVAQMNAAAQIALEYAKQHFPLLAILSQGADTVDVQRVMTGANKDAAGTDTAFLDARNRVGHRIQRNLDGIQIALGSRWRLWMQLVSIGLTIAFVELAILSNANSAYPSDALIGVALGVVGGYLAPVTRDLVAALQSLRKT